MDYKRKPFYVASYIDEYYNIPRNILFDYTTNKLFTISDTGEDIEIGKETANSIIQRYIDSIRDGVVSNGDTFKKVKDLLDAISEWVNNNNYKTSGVNTLLDVLEYFKNLDMDFMNEMDNKVDKVNGYSLSSNDFTDEDLYKLRNIEENANKYTHPKNTICDFKPPVTSLNSRTGHVKITKKELGLENVEEGANMYLHPHTLQCDISPISSVNNKAGDVILNKNDLGLSEIQDMSLTRTDSDFLRRGSNFYANSKHVVYNYTNSIFQMTKRSHIESLRRFIFVNVSPKDCTIELFLRNRVNVTTADTNISLDVPPDKYFYKITHPRQSEVIMVGQVNLFRSIDYINHSLHATYRYSLVEVNNVDIISEIYIDHMWVEFTNTIEVEEGDYRVKASAVGYETIEWDVSITHHLEETINLIGKRFFLKINLDPEVDLMISIYDYINDTVLENVERELTLNAGEYRVDVQGNSVFSDESVDVMLWDDDKEITIELYSDPVTVYWVVKDDPEIVPDGVSYGIPEEDEEVRVEFITCADTGRVLRNTGYEPVLGNIRRDMTIEYYAYLVKKVHTIPIDEDVSYTSKIPVDLEGDEFYIELPRKMLNIGFNVVCNVHATFRLWTEDSNGNIIDEYIYEEIINYHIRDFPEYSINFEILSEGLEKISGPSLRYVRQGDVVEFELRPENNSTLCIVNVVSNVPDSIIWMKRDTDESYFETDSLIVDSDTEISYKVFKEGYGSMEGSQVIVEDTTIEVILQPTSSGIPPRPDNEPSVLDFQIRYIDRSGKELDIIPNKIRVYSDIYNEQKNVSDNNIIWYVPARNTIYTYNIEAPGVKMHTGTINATNASHIINLNIIVDTEIFHNVRMEVTTRNAYLDIIEFINIDDSNKSLTITTGNEMTYDKTIRLEQGTYRYFISGKYNRTPGYDQHGWPARGYNPRSGTMNIGSDRHIKLDWPVGHKG